MVVSDQTAEIAAILYRVLADRLDHIPSEACVAFLLKLKTIRWYAFSSEEELMDLWDDIRAMDLVTDLVVDTTVDFQIQITLNGLGPIEWIAETIGQALDATRGSLVDADFRNRSVEAGMAAIMKDNHWLVVCYLISRLDIRPLIERVRATVPKTPAE